MRIDIRKKTNYSYKVSSENPFYSSFFGRIKRLQYFDKLSTGCKREGTFGEAETVFAQIKKLFTNDVKSFFINVFYIKRKLFFSQFLHHFFADTGGRISAIVINILHGNHAC